MRKSPSRHGTSLQIAAPRRAAPPPSDVWKRLVNAYYVRRGRGELVLVARDDEGGLHKKRVPPQHACFLKQSEVDAELARELRGHPAVTGMRPEGDFVRVIWRNPWDLHRATKDDGFFASIGVTPYEADVDPVRRYLTDNDVEIRRPRRCYLDIESDSRVAPTEKENARMLAWSIVDDEAMVADEVRVLCPHEEDRERCPSCKKLDDVNARVVFKGRGGVVASGVLEADTDEDERALLEAMWAALEPYDQVCAWAGDFFDFPYARARTARRRVPVDVERWLWLDQLVNFRRMNMSAAESGDEKQSMALAAVSRSVVKIRETKLEGLSGAASWQMWCEDKSLLLRYCEQDTRLAGLIERRTGYVELLYTLCHATTTFADSNGIKPTRQVEGFLLRLGAARGLRFPTHYYHEGGEQFDGAFVMEPEAKGVVRGVHVCDFARLYPSVILSFNLSLETVRGKLPKPLERGGRPSYMAHEAEPEPRDRIPEGCALVPLTRVLVAQEPRGVLAVALEEMLRLRKEWDKKKAAASPGTTEWKEADRRSSAYKIAANSFYGVVGSPYSRFFVREVAESTSQGGVWLIKETIRAAQERGIRVIYGDTDSAFAVDCTDAEFVAFVEWCNAELYPRLLREQGSTRNVISLAYEKKFASLVMVSKKRYAASYEHYKGTAATKDSKLEVKGLEYKRGDTSRLARRMQLEIVELLLRDGVEDPCRFEELVERHRARVLEDRLDLADVVISKRLTKALGQYATKQKKNGERAEQSTHVEIARVLHQRGQEVRQGDRIDFVVVDGGVAPIRAIPAADHDGETEGRSADRFYLWEQLVYPPSQRFLEAAFPGHDWTRWERVRPPKPRRMGRPVPPEQTGFGFD